MFKIEPDKLKEGEVIDFNSFKMLKGCKCGLVKFAIDPEDSTVKINSFELDLKAFKNQVPFLEGEYEIQIKKKDYFPYLGKFKVESGKTINFKRKLLSFYGYLTVKSEPMGATVLLNSRKIGNTPIIRYKLRHNYYDLTVGIGKLYKVFKKRIKIRPEQELKLNVKLEPNYGRFYINSNPEGAIIYINGIAAGYSPFSIEKMPAGKYKIKIVKKGYQTVEEEIEIKAKEQNNFIYDLTSMFNVIELPEEIVDNYQIYVDGKKVKIYKKNKLKIYYGNHKIEFKSDKYKDKIYYVKSKRGEELKLGFLELEPVLGSIDVQTEPSDTKIYLEKKFLGVSPLRLDNIPIGDYIVKLKRDSYIGYVKIKVEKGKITKIKMPVYKKMHPLFERLGIEFVYVQGGEFEMGSNKRRDERPVHKVWVDSFLMSKYEITNRQFGEFIKSTNYKFPEKEDIFKEEIANYPVRYVSYYDALKFCEWLSSQTGLKVNLPTEAQWEYVARYPDGRFFPWGKTFIYKRANSIGSYDGYGELAPVDAFPEGANPLGIFNLLGNVWEWCLDYYSGNFYKFSPYKNPLYDKPEPFGVLRGGSYLTPIVQLRNTTRRKALLNRRDKDFGFRIIVEIPENYKIESLLE